MNNVSPDPRLQVDETLCFICQEESPKFRVTRGKENFKLCTDCKCAVIYENDKRNRIKNALSQGHAGQMLKMTLGMNLLPTRIMVEDLEVA